MTKIYHSVFDGNLIGSDLDYRIHVSRSLLEEHDRPMLEHRLSEFLRRD